VPKISQDYNPATWMLEITNTAVENRTGQDFAALYANSDMYRFVQVCHVFLTCNIARLDRMSESHMFSAGNRSAQ